MVTFLSHFILLSLAIMLFSFIFEIFLGYRFVSAYFQIM